MRRSVRAQRADARPVDRGDHPQISDLTLLVCFRERRQTGCDGGLAVEPEEFRGDWVLGTLLTSHFAGKINFVPPFAGSQSENLGKRLEDGGRGVIGHQKSGAMRHHVRDAANAGCDNQAPGRHSFQNRLGHGLTVAGAKDDVDVAHRRTGVLDEAAETHKVRYAGLLCHLLASGEVVRIEMIVAEELESGAGAEHALEPAYGFHGLQLAFPGLQASK